ncbi:ADP-ribosylglycohydrolase [Apiospora marii]|uniref:ADP-ribosylglycohydrolase n=1 Tax=Apiospora marii TaxID=335849 RepID=A0ABR1RRF1_9PEZI
MATSEQPVGPSLDPADHLERIYAGVLGKLIGVYLGRPFEGWSHRHILNQLGPIHYYVHDRLGQPLVVTDDDIAGPFTFIRAIEEHPGGPDGDGPSSEQIGTTWLNNVVEEQSVFWWGGKGISTEHTAYLSLKSGIAAPLSGAIGTNGKTVAEQVGGQIFIDGWAMLSPGNPSQAARLAENAARVSHDGEAVHAAKLWAAMEAEAFVSDDVDHLLDTGLTFIPSDCLIVRLVGDVRQWVEENGDWHKTRQRIDNAYGYHKFEGECHVIPNHGIMIMAVLYARGNFHQAMHIIATSGWDTDSNGGNVGCLVAIMSGLKGFRGGPDWRGPVSDRAFISTADGGYAINNASRLALDTANLGRQLRGQKPLQPPKNGAQFHFTFPGSVQGFRCHPNITTRVEQTMDPWGFPVLAIQLFQHGPRSGPVKVLTDTHHPADLPTTGQIYPLAASPLVYPGQVVRARVRVEHTTLLGVRCQLIVQTYDGNGQISNIRGPFVELRPTIQHDLEWTVPDTESYQPIHAIGVEVSCTKRTVNVTVGLDYLRWEGIPKFTLGLPNGNSAKSLEYWKRAWVGNADLLPTWNPPSFNIVNNSGEGLLAIGTREWTDYTVTISNLKVKIGGPAGVIFRTRGLNRWYGLLLTNSGTRVSIVKARDDQRTSNPNLIPIMPFSFLPQEIFDGILVAVVHALGSSKAALRLRKVSRAWAAAMVGAIYASRIIDHEDTLYLWPQYIAYKASGPDPPEGWLRPLLMLRQAGERVVAYRQDKDDDALRRCISEVCAVARISTPFYPCSIRDRFGQPIESDDKQLLQTLLAIAAYTNDVGLAQHLLSDIPGPLSLISRGATEHPRALFDEPLVAAAYTGHDEVLRLFLDHKLRDPDRWNVWLAKNMVLKGAVEGNHASTVKLALELDPGVHDPYGEKLTAVFYGCLEYAADVDIFDLLYDRARHFLHRGLVPYYDDNPRFWSDNCLPGLLCKAAERGNVPLLRRLMELGAAPESGTSPTDSSSSSLKRLEGAVWCAARHGRAEAVTYLLDTGFPAGEAWKAAVKYGNPQTFELLFGLVDKDRSPHLGQDVMQYLDVAKHRGHDAIVRKLLRSGWYVPSEVDLWCYKEQAESLGLQPIPD